MMVDLDAPASAEPAGDHQEPRRARRLLFVASTGGHLTELNRLAGRMAPAEDSVWLTFDSEQSRSLLQGRRVEFVPYVAPRDVRGARRTFFAVRDLLKREHFDEVVSTGAALAIGAFMAARLARTPTRYIESVARLSGPSLTGRLAHALRLAKLHTQNTSWAGRRWSPIPSVLEEFQCIERNRPVGRPLRLFVTLGTIRPYRFDALIDAVLASGAANEDTVWQVGSTDRSDLPGTVARQMPHEAFIAAARAADVVVTHGGVGTIVELLDLGVHPVVVPRSSRRGEHVDDHQYEITRHLDSLGIATVAEAGALGKRQLEAAAVRATRARQD